MNVALKKPLIAGFIFILFITPTTVMAWGWGAPRKSDIPPAAIAWNPPTTATTAAWKPTAVPLVADGDNSVSPTKPHSISEWYWSHSISEAFWKRGSFWH